MNYPESYAPLAWELAAFVAFVWFLMFAAMLPVACSMAWDKWTGKYDNEKESGE